MDVKRNSSFAAKIKKGVRNMRSTFNILFYVNKSKLIPISHNTQNPFHILRFIEHLAVDLRIGLRPVIP